MLLEQVLDLRDCSVQEAPQAVFPSKSCCVKHHLFTSQWKAENVNSPMCLIPLIKPQLSTCSLLALQRNTKATRAPHCICGLRVWCCTQLSQSTWEASPLAPPLTRQIITSSLLFLELKKTALELWTPPTSFFSPQSPPTSLGAHLHLGQRTISLTHCSWHGRATIHRDLTCGEEPLLPYLNEWSFKVEELILVTI